MARPLSYDKMFDTIDWNNIPSMISHEVIRSNHYFQEEKYFLVIYQIKDMYEVLIKTLSLTAIANYEQKFGEWHKISEESWLAKFFEFRERTPESGISPEKLKAYFKNVCDVSREKQTTLTENPLDDYSRDEILEYCRFRGVLNMVLTKALSLGDWIQGILHEVAGFKALAPSLKATCSDLFSVISNEGTNKFNLTAWRNNWIGHGALSSQISEEDIELIEKMLKILIGVIYRNLDLFYGMNFYLSTDNNGRTLLNGKQQAVELPEGDYKVQLSMEAQEETIQIDPLIKVTGRGIYVFDSFVPYKIDTFSIDYPNGKRKKSHPDLTRWLMSLRNKTGVTMKSLYSSIHSAVLDNSVSEQLDNLTKARDFVEPEFLKQKVQSFIEGNDRGLFLLYLDRGMGKSYFAKGLNQLDETKDVFDSKETFWFIRTVHLNTYTLYNLPLFFQRLPKAINPNGQTRRFTLEYSSENDKPDKIRLNVARFLNNIKREVFTEGHFILVIDGLDELPVNEENSILNCIPKKEMLDTGVFILMTSRTEEGGNTLNDASKNIFTEIASMAKTCQVQTETIHNDNPAYLKFVYDYLKKNQIRFPKAVESKILADPNMRRMVYLSILVKCVKATDLEETSVLENIVAVYTEMLIRQIEGDSTRISTSEWFLIESKYMKIVTDVNVADNV